MHAALAARNHLLKVIPHADGTPRCELVRYGLADVVHDYLAR